MRILSRRGRTAACFILILMLLCGGPAICESNETAVPDNWNLRVMGFDLLKEAAEHEEKLQAPMLVAVIDTGCDTGHEIFRGRISGDSRSYFGREDDVSNPDGHGTTVASVIAAATPDNVKLLILKVGEYGEYASDELFEQAIEYALEKGADVINFCISIPTDKPVSQGFRVWCEGIRRCREAGVPFVCGAGNNGVDAAWEYPAADVNADAVAAVTPQDVLWYKSNYGDAVRFSAPGAWIRAAKCGTIDEYLYKSGTSVAAPHITAAITYIKMLHPDWSCKQIEDALRSCATGTSPNGGKNTQAAVPAISKLILDRDPEEKTPMYVFSRLTAGDAGKKDEGPENLFDGDPGSKWCLDFTGVAYVEWETGEPVSPSGILLGTGNDSGRQPGRNPYGMKLFGRKNTDEAWKLIWEQAPEQILPDQDYTFRKFTFPRPAEPYSFFRLEIHSTGGSSVLQLSMAELTEE